MSNVFCADCFVTRLKSLFDHNARKDIQKVIIKAYCSENDVKKNENFDCKTVRITTKMLNYMIKNHEKDLLMLVGNNLKAMARCEHARWNVEKLILGFSPFSPQEHYEYNCRFGFSRSSYRNGLKKNKGHHINLCSYEDLYRIDPDNMKYDSFLMLAMVKILKEGITG